MSPVTISQRYAIDAGMSRLTVRAFATGMFSAFGHNPTIAVRDLTGEADFAPGALDQARLALTIKSASLSVTDNISDKDRREIERTMHQEVLESARYPEIVFQSTKVSASQAGGGQFFVNLIGDLTLHGVTGPQAVAAQVALLGETLRASGEFSLLQTAYGIRPISIGGGSLKLRDEVKCSFDILARKVPNHD